MCLACCLQLPVKTCFRFVGFVWFDRMKTVRDAWLSGAPGDVTKEVVFLQVCVLAQHLGEVFILRTEEENQCLAPFGDCKQQLQQ